MLLLAINEISYIYSTQTISFGNKGLGSTTDNLLKLKFFIALAQAPIFSDNCGLCRINVTDFINC